MVIMTPWSWPPCVIGLTTDGYFDYCCCCGGTAVFDLQHDNKSTPHQKQILLLYNNRLSANSAYTVFRHRSMLLWSPPRNFWRWNLMPAGFLRVKNDGFVFVLIQSVFYTLSRHQPINIVVCFYFISDHVYAFARSLLWIRWAEGPPQIHTAEHFSLYIKQNIFVCRMI